MLKKIKVINKWLYGICLWNSDYLFVGCEDNIIRLIELKTGRIIENLNAHNNKVFTVKKIKHDKYGEFFLSQGFLNKGIKLWINLN